MPLLFFAFSEPSRPQTTSSCLYNQFYTSQARSGAQIGRWRPPKFDSFASRNNVCGPTLWPAVTARGRLKPLHTLVLRCAILGPARIEQELPLRQPLRRRQLRKRPARFCGLYTSELFLSLRLWHESIPNTSSCLGLLIEPTSDNNNDHNGHRATAKLRLLQHQSPRPRLAFTLALCFKSHGHITFFPLRPPALQSKPQLARGGLCNFACSWRQRASVLCSFCYGFRLWHPYLTFTIPSTILRNPPVTK